MVRFAWCSSLVSDSSLLHKIIYRIWHSVLIHMINDEKLIVGIKAYAIFL